MKSQDPKKLIHPLLTMVLQLLKGFDKLTELYHLPPRCICCSRAVSSSSSSESDSLSFDWDQWWMLDSTSLVNWQTLAFWVWPINSCFIYVRLFEESGLVWGVLIKAHHQLLEEASKFSVLSMWPRSFDILHIVQYLIMYRIRKI